MVVLGWGARPPTSWTRRLHELGPVGCRPAVTDEPPPLCKIHLVPCHCQSQSEKNITQGDSSHRPIYAECRSKQELVCTCVTLQNAIILQTVRLRKALERAQGWT